MDHFMKSFSVIDFLGIFTPGALVTLAYNAYFGGVAEPFTKFFNDQSLTLVIYFVFLSYLVGILLQEVSKWLEKVIYCKIDSHVVWQKNPKVQELYKKIFRRSISVMAQQDGGEDSPDDAWTHIYQYVQPEVQQAKLPLFQAFASMARSCCVAALLIMLLKWNAHGSDPEMVGSCLRMSAVCVVIAVIMGWRCRRFHKRVIEYSYITFLQLDGKENKKEAGK